MKLVINGKATELAQESLTVSELLQLEKVKMPEMVSVQLNGAFVDRGDFESKTVAQGDEVDFLYFMGGGR